MLIDAHVVRVRESHNLGDATCVDEIVGVDDGGHSGQRIGGFGSVRGKP
jgi:hypothetical protein